MKYAIKLIFLFLLVSCLPALAQFRRTSDNRPYPYTNTMLSSDVFIIGRPLGATPPTNYNFAFSNLARFMTNVAVSVDTGGTNDTIYVNNAYITNLYATFEYVSNAFITNLYATTEYVSNAFITNLISNFSYISNAYITNLTANNTFISNAFITNLTVVNFSGLTNNTDRAGISVGSGIGTNLTDYARLSAITNNFTGSMGVNVVFGTATATANTLDVSQSIHSSISGNSNAIAIWDPNGYLTNSTGLIAPTNTAVVGQVLHASSTGGASKWDYVNQALTNSNPRVPDFNLPVNYWVTNAVFLFLDPANVDTTGKKLQVTDCFVTNSTAAAVAVTFPGSIHVTGTAFVTNLSVFHFRQFAGLWTNCACEPVW